MKFLQMLAIITAVLGLCVSCASTPTSPDEAYLGRWAGTYEGESITADFEPNHVCVISGHGEVHVGNWMIKDGGVVVEVNKNSKDNLHAFVTHDGQMIFTLEAAAFVLNREKPEEKQ